MKFSSPPIGTTSVPPAKKKWDSLLETHCYQDRLKMALVAAQLGMGFEDLMVAFHIGEIEARRIVFGRV